MLGRHLRCLEALRSIFEGALLLLGVCKAETFYCFNLQTLMETPQTHPRRVWLLSGLGELEGAYPSKSLRVSS